MKNLFLLALISTSSVFAADCYKRDYTIGGTTTGANIHIYDELFINASDSQDARSITNDIINGIAFDSTATTLANTSSVQKTKIQSIQLELMGSLAYISMDFTNLLGQKDRMTGIYKCSQLGNAKYCEDFKGSQGAFRLINKSGRYDIQLNNRINPYAKAPLMVYDHVGIEAAHADFYDHNGEVTVIKSDVYNMNKVECSEENGFF